MSIIIVLIVFGALLCGLALLCFTVIYALRGGRQNRTTTAEETQLIQELYHGLSEMERRVESLETLLLEQGRKGERL